MNDLTPLAMEQIRVRAVFNRRNAILGTGETAPITIEVYFSRDKRVFIPTNISIKQDDWGTTGKHINKIKPSHPNYIELNHFIGNKISEIEGIAYANYNINKPFTPDNLVDWINNKRTSVSFYEHYENELASDNKLLSIGTIKEHRYTLNVLKEYKPTLDFSEIDFEFVQGFDRFLRSKTLSKKATAENGEQVAKVGMKQNTIHKHHKHILRYLNIGIKLKHFKSEDNPYLLFKSKKVKGDRENLDKDEFEAIKKLEFGATQHSLEYVRDLFVFGCTTGLRFGDIMNLTSSNIEIKGDAITIRTTMEKVEHSRNIKVVLPLHLLFNGIPLAIFNKYNISSTNKDRKVFKSVTNQEVNRQLKSIALACKIDSMLSFHIARHTFGTFLADICGNPYLIMELMGHADIKTSMIYIHQSEERLLNNLKSISNWI